MEPTRFLYLVRVSGADFEAAKVRRAVAAAAKRVKAVQAVSDGSVSPYLLELLGLCLMFI